LPFLELFSPSRCEQFGEKVVVVAPEVFTGAISMLPDRQVALAEDALDAPDGSVGCASKGCCRVRVAASVHGAVGNPAFKLPI
jgi:hypothetical protein